MHRPFLLIKEKKVQCTVHVPKNMGVFAMEGKIFSKPSEFTVHIGNDVHILDYFGSYLSHSFSPNCIIDGFNVIAIKDIIPGDILTYDFNKTEVNMAKPFIYQGILIRGLIKTVTCKKAYETTYNYSDYRK